MGNVYDAAGRLRFVSNERGKITETRYDAADRRVALINPLNQRHTYKYDPAGNQRRRIDARLQITTSAYDGDNRELRRLYQDGTRVTFQYDPNGNRTLLSDSTGEYNSSYDELNRVEEAIDPGVPDLFIAPQTIQYQYDAVGRRKRMLDPDGGIHTTLHDPAGQLTRIINPALERTTFGYDSLGRNTAKFLANGTRASLSYDARGSLDRLVNLDSVATTISEYMYGYDGVGDRTSIDQFGMRYSNWIYDGIEQLGHDLYFELLGCKRFTLPQWWLFSVEDWATLPDDALGVRTSEVTYDPTGNWLR